MNRPESKLAAGVVVLGLSAAMLLNVALVSCEESRSVGAGGGLPGGVVGTQPEQGAEPVMPVAGRVDYAVSRLGSEPEVRVRLAAMADRVAIAPVGGATVRIGPAGIDAVPTGNLMVAGAATITLESAGGGGSWVVRSGAVELGRVPAGAGVFLGVQPVGAGSRMKVNGGEYPGRVRLISRSEQGGKLFDVIEHLPLEEYLPGVVAKEMYAGWPLGAYQAQAVAARTYAIHEMMRDMGTSAVPRGTFDVEAGERDQAYVGSTSNRTAVEAVRSTRGMILSDGGQVLRTYYSSTCGGRTGSARDTWPTGPGYEFNLAGPIQARAREFACQKSPQFRWSVTRDRAEVVQRLRAYGQKSQLQVRNIRDLWAVEPLTVNADGRPSAYKVVEPGGTWYKLSGEQMRLALNTSVPRAVGSAVGGVGVGGVGEPLAGPVALGAGETVPAVGEELAVPNAEAVAAPVPDVDRKSRVMSSDFEVVGPREGRTVTISGRGYGHGVGMCQYCAKGFAERGEDWRVMLMRFYPGAQVVKGY